MPTITTKISYEDDFYGRGEYTEYSREFSDLDIYDFRWVLQAICDKAGFDVKEVKLVTGAGKIIEGDF